MLVQKIEEQAVVVVTRDENHPGVYIDTPAVVALLVADTAAVVAVADAVVADAVVVDAVAAVVAVVGLVVWWAVVVEEVSVDVMNQLASELTVHLSHPEPEDWKAFDHLPKI